MAEFQLPSGARRLPKHWAGRASFFLGDAREHERAGRLDEAMAQYRAAIERAQDTSERATLAEGLRRLGVVHHLRGELNEARQLCQQSHAAALLLGDDLLTAEALNTLAGFDIEAGSFDSASAYLDSALGLAATSAELRARIEQNLGVVANIHGDLPAALEHYERSLDAFRASHDERGCALAYHNLGMISADQRLWDDADHYFRQSREIADAIGDVYLRGLCLLNHTEVFLAWERFEEARESAEAALQIFDRLGARDAKAVANRFLGVLYRETGAPALAESHLRDAIAFATEAESPLEEAEASRELAVLLQRLGRNQDALQLLNTAHRLFGRIDARTELVDIAAKTAELESTFLTVVRDWGQSIESADSYTFGHCERVGTYAVRVAQALGLSDIEQTTVRLGAYLHDVGKVRVSPQILNKPGALTRDEAEIMRMHPIYGLELLAAIEFPWGIKPIIRWHHEKLDGSGYPDRLRGDEIPLHAQIICIVDVYDALTTTRSYRAALPPEQGVAELISYRRWWQPNVFEAFMECMGV